MYNVTLYTEHRKVYIPRLSNDNFVILLETMKSKDIFSVTDPGGNVRVVDMSKITNIDADFTH